MMKGTAEKKFYCFLLLFLCLSGCSVSPKEDVSHVGMKISDINPEKKQEIFASEFKHTSPNLGVSLSGGGMRSASFSVGVLSGLDEVGILPKVDYLSTVSGGGYAAYWYVSSLYHSQRISLEKALLEPKVDSSLFFNDCYPASEKDGFPLYKNTENHFYETCKGYSDRLTSQYRFQNQIAQQSDLLNYYQDGSSGIINGLKVNTIQIMEYAGILSAHIVSLPVHHVANTIFDWNVQISPVKSAYNFGIDRAFGLYPKDLTRGHVDTKVYQNSQAFLWMDNYSAKDITFEELQNAYKESTEKCSAYKRKSKSCSKMPFWILNTASNLNRNVCGFDAPKTKTDRVFEFTPVSYGSDRNGFVYKPYSNLTLSDVVQLSGAAMDSQYSMFASPIGAGVLHLANLNLGEKIDNYHPDSPTSHWRTLLPIPFYCFPKIESPTQASSIYLSDGAHVEHTGAYALIRRGVKNIIMVDASEDDKGEWLELKNLASMLLEEHNLNMTLFNEEHNPIPLVDVNGKPVLSAVANPLNAMENIYYGTITGFTPGFIDRDEKNNFIRLWLIKTGIVPKRLALNCDDKKAYPCSVSRFIEENYLKQYKDCEANHSGVFPNHSTIRTSAEMTVSIYNAYRDLGKFIAERLNISEDGELAMNSLNTEVESLKPLVTCE
jgi:hypothetical protein